MTRIVNKFAVDLTGRKPENLIVSEKHELTPSASSGQLRVMIPNYGGFYTESVVLRDGTGTRMKPREDYIASFLYENASVRSGLEVCGSIIVTNPNVSNVVYIDYQVVGGDLAVSTTALHDVLEALAEDGRPVEWGNIIGKPNTYPTGGHLHALWELYGFEYVVVELERITQAIIAGYQPSLDEVREYALTLHNEGKDYTDDVDNRLSDHRNDWTNPHRVTKAQVGLGVVENHPMANVSEAEDGGRDDRYMSPKRTSEAIDFQIGDYTRTHVNDRTNPHQVTKAQVGLGVVENYPPTDVSAAKEGTDDASYMTPLRTAQAIESQLGVRHTAHLSDYRNPHQVTKAQVGLGSVEDHPLASYSDAVSGSRNNRYMTPLRVSQYVSNQISGLASRSYVDTAVNRSTSFEASTVNSSSMWLTLGGRYLVTVYGYTNNRGGSHHTMIGPGIKDSNGTWLSKCPNVRINWPDGNAPQTATMVINLNSGNGKITGHTDGAVLTMTALRIG